MSLLSMFDPLFSDGWRDVIALVSLGVTSLGFIFAIWQIRKTKSVAEAARAAARSALTESQKSYRHFTAAIAHRLITDVKSYVQAGNWHIASLRLSDLADQVAQLVGNDPEWKEVATQLRKWADLCFRQLTPDENHKFDRDKWAKFFLKLHSKIDTYFGPYPVIPETSDDT